MQTRPTTPIVYENNDFLVVNKPNNVSFHTENNQLGIVATLEQSLEQKLWPVHRLDRITSGLLIAAKNKQSAQIFSELFLKQQINKTYLAISDKKPKKKQGKIAGDMQKSRNGSWQLLRTQTNPAITEFLSQPLLPGKRLFYIKPKTGKTHQIRVALKSLGSPILGDQRYKGTESDRGYLHAYQLDFIWMGKPVQISVSPENGSYFLIPELAQCLQNFTF